MYLHVLKKLGDIEVLGQVHTFSSEYFFWKWLTFFEFAWLDLFGDLKIADENLQIHLYDRV